LNQIDIFFQILKVIGDIQLKTLASLQSKSDADLEEAIKKCIVKGI